MNMPAAFRFFANWLEKVHGMCIRGDTLYFDKGFCVGKVRVTEDLMRKLTEMAEGTTATNTESPPADGLSPPSGDFDDALFPATAGELRTGSKPRKG